MQRIYISIDLKSFYASVECRERGLNPLTTNLVVADSSRTEKTVCLAVSPSLKKHGIAGRARLFEVIQKVREVNSERRYKAPGHVFKGKSYDDTELQKHPEYELDYIVATPQMKKYMKYSTDIYNIYLQYFSPEDIYVYSIDEVFIDITHYLKTYNMKATELVTKVINDVYDKTKITATAGIATNLYLCKVAMDIVAKHTKPNEKGVRIACLDEMMYRKKLWEHRPLTDFWRVGKGYAKKLEQNGMFTMGDVALCSIHNEELLYKLFGVNAELLIDHAWGYEPCNIQDIKAYKPVTNSISSGQVLHCPYDYEKTKLIVREMTDLLILDLVEKNLVTNQIVLTIGYDIENLSNPSVCKEYKGEITIDRYGRKIPKHAHGTINLERHTSSSKVIIDAVMSLYEKIINKSFLNRRVTIVANNVQDENLAKEERKFEQIDLFTDYETLSKKQQQEEIYEKKEKNLQHTLIDIKKRYGKNAILKGMNLVDGSTTIERNGQIGGHKG